MQNINVGVLGFGTVGSGVVENLQSHAQLIADRTAIYPTVAKIADLDTTTDRGVELPSGVLTSDAEEVVSNPEIDVVVELIGGTGVARDFILKALENGKPVVTANKALLAYYGDEIFDAAANSGADVYYEASVAGGIPIIKAMREGLVANKIDKITGILNGTCNFILTRMEQDGASFEKVLEEAQNEGYAEADPSLDVDGYDAAHKTSILASLAYGEWFGMDPLYLEGIRNVTLADIKYAGQLGYKIKLLAVIKQDEKDIQLRIHPALVHRNSTLAHVDDVVNGVCVRGDTVGETMYTGLGAGREATASAVVADIVDVGLNIRSGAHSRVAPFRAHENSGKVISMEEVYSRHYIRLLLRNKPGVLAKIAGILGEMNISIASVTQHEAIGEDASVVILTDAAQEANIQNALAQIKKHDFVEDDPVHLRIEDEP